MHVILGVLMSCCLSTPAGGVPADVVATDLSGDRVSGQLKSLTAEAAIVTTPEGDRTLALERLIELRWSSPQHDPLPAGQVYLVDGSLLSFDTLSTAAREVQLTSPVYGELRLPLNVVRAIRFAKVDAAPAAWARLLGRTRSKDLLVLPRKNKPGELDPTTGVVGQIADASLKFVLGGDEIPVGRKRVFGVVYGRRPVATTAGYLVEIGGQDRIAADAVLLTENSVELVFAGGSKAAVPIGFVHRIDLSGGKVRYLDEMKPIFHEFTPVLPDPLYEQVFHYRTNETMDGEPLRLGGKTYSRGLWVHSKTTLRYALGGAFSRFEAVTGIDDEIPRRDKTKARLTIRADERVVFDEDIWISDPPRALKCNLGNAQVLEIVVDFGEKRADGTPPLHAALQDWVDLADARVLK